MEPSDWTYAQLEREIGDASELIERYEVNSSMRAWYRAIFGIRFGSFTLDDYARAVTFGRDLERLVPLAVAGLAGYRAEAGERRAEAGESRAEAGEYGAEAGEYGADDGEAVADLLTAFSGLPDEWWRAHSAHLAALMPLADRIAAGAARFEPDQRARIESACEKLCARATEPS